MAIEAVLFDLDDTLSRRTAPRDWNVVTALQVAQLAPHCERLGFGHLDLDAVVRRFWTSFDASYPDPDSHPEAPIEELRWREGSNAIRKTLAEYRVACAPDDANCLWRR